MFTTNGTNAPSASPCLCLTIDSQMFYIVPKVKQRPSNCAQLEAYYGGIPPKYVLINNYMLFYHVIKQ